MADKYITSIHIQKLGHEIQEIRERSLFNIISKLDHGFGFDNDLARSKELLLKLFEWFLSEPCTYEKTVFALIKRVLKSESGKTLISHCGAGFFKKELKQIRTYVDPAFYKNLDEIVQILDQYQSEVIVPPLESDLPLSYRTGDELNSARHVVGSTATTIEGYICQNTSRRQEAGVETMKELPHNYIISPLKWQTLIEPDRHVLNSVEVSLRRPPEPSTLLHSAEFFSNVLLHDFPAEIFLQRPNIVFAFHDLLNNCPSSRVKNSVLSSLCQLTKALQVRVNHYNDPCMHNSKENICTQANSQRSSPNSFSRKTASGQSDEDTERPENINTLKTQQMSFPTYCYYTYECVFKFLDIKPESLRESPKKLNQKGINLSLTLLQELLNLLSLIIGSDIWNQSFNPILQEVIKLLNEILIEYGTILEHFRLETFSNDSNLSCRVTYLFLLQNCASFLKKIVPISQTGLILPKNLKTVLTNSLIDVTLAKLYPDTHAVILEYVQSFSVGLEPDSIIKYQETNRVCESMTAAVQFMKNKSLNAYEGINVAVKALPSLEFHRDLNFVKGVFELCSEKLPLYPNDEELLQKFELVILKLLSHNLEEIQEETYRLCQKRVIVAVGPKFNVTGTGVPGSQILFLLRSNILIEMALYGVTSENLQIQKCAEDILIHLIKCKILVSNDIWNKTVEALIPALPILLCHSGKNSALGRNLLNIIDPDNAESLLIPKIEVLKANVHILFSPDPSLREEAFSRLCWLLGTQGNSKEMLPRLNNLYDKALPHICQVQRIFDINKNRISQNFYQPSSLQQVLDLLRSPDVEPVVRRSALTQISVMMEDPLLHRTFIENHGLETVVEIIKMALVENNFNDYPDSVIPAITILKNICLYQPRARQELGINVEIYFNVLRAAFMFFAEERLKQDAVILLFLLIFNDFVVGSPSKGDFSIPLLVNQKILVPFSCNNHWEVSQNTEQSCKTLLTSDKWCLSSIQIQWNCEIFGGLDKLLSWKKINYDHVNIVDILKLKEYDLTCLKASSVNYCIKKFLVNIQNGTTHEIIIESIDKLISYIHLHRSYKCCKDSDFLSHPWEETFSRFLKTLPSSEEDVKLLSSVLNFLKLLISFYKSSEQSIWLSDLLKNPNNCLLDLITFESSSSEEFKSVSQDLLALITTCALQEQNFLQFYVYDVEQPTIDRSSWINVIKIICNSLRFNDNTHFYNLAHLDALLECLVHLTATLGWSNSKSDQAPNNVLTQLVPALCELIVVFHCGKGPTAAISVMGLNITRHVILILNHLLAEMHNSKLKHWENCFMNVEEQTWLKSFLVLWSSRDVVLRAGAFQFFAGLSVSPRLAIDIVNELKHENGGVWNMVLVILLDEDEASIVKENCAYLLTNLTGHTVLNQFSKITLLPGLLLENTEKEQSGVILVFNLLEDFQFFKTLAVIFSNLYTHRIIDFDLRIIRLKVHNYNTSNNEISSSKSSDTNSKDIFIVTPSFVKSLSHLLLNLFLLDSETVSSKFQDYGLSKLLLRCICNPTMSVSDTRKLSLYCEILEMNTSICLLLNQVSTYSQSCLGTVLHTRDCLNVVISLLNPKCYQTHLPQLIFLRNRLWSEIFKLLATLSRFENDFISRDALKILSETIEEVGKKSFIETLCAALRSAGFNDLQNSALSCLFHLLKSETQIITKNLRSPMIQNLLDSCKTGNSNGEFESKVVAGSEVCKILLNLYDLSNLKASKNILKKKTVITATLSVLLCISQEAKNFALNNKLLDTLMKQLKDFCVKLSLESVDCLRRVLDKKRVCPVLKELNELVGLTTNFMVGDETVKSRFAEMGLSDLIHKLWIWFCVQKDHLIDVLKLLCTFTTDCAQACQSLPLTSPVAGSGPRKAPSNISLIHAIVKLIEKEMEQVSRTHNLSMLELSFIILNNCCSVIECRIILSKSNLLQCISRLHPAITKRQKPWGSVEAIWLEFLQTFSLYPEGQSCIAKINDVFELVMALTSAKSTNKISALLVLRNIAFYQPNRARLLMSDDFLRILQNKLETGIGEEVTTVILIMWSLAANNQKAKLIFKSAQLNIKLEEVLKQYELRRDVTVHDEDVKRINYVLNMINDGEKSR